MENLCGKILNACNLSAFLNPLLPKHKSLKVNVIISDGSVTSTEKHRLGLEN